MSDIENRIREIADEYSKILKKKIDERVQEMKQDDNSHYLIYLVLGIEENEGNKIDIYQNKGRFLYKYAGSFLEEVATQCLLDRFPNASAKIKIPNNQGSRPKTFEIDCLVDKRAYEIKWRDATTDGDHITKEHTRAKAIKEHGFTPIRIMFYYPNRQQAIKIQQTIKTLYKGLGGEHYFGDKSWEYIKKTTNIDLKYILTKLAKENAGKLQEK